MRNLFPVCVVSAASLLALSAPANAATLTYTGQTYNSTSYDLAENATSSGGRPFRGSYDTTMNYSMSFELSEALRANTFYDFYGAGQVSTAMTDGITDTFYLATTTAFDGFNHYDDGFGTLMTDTAGQVLSWAFTFYEGAQDYNFSGSTSADGDNVGYYYEYGIDDGTTMFCCGGEQSTASASQLGIWSGTALTAVPLPSSLSFLLIGLGGLGLHARSRKRAA